MYYFVVVKSSFVKFTSIYGFLTHLCLILCITRVISARIVLPRASLRLSRRLPSDSWEVNFVILPVVLLACQASLAVVEMSASSHHSWL